MKTLLKILVKSTVAEIILISAAIIVAFAAAFYSWYIGQASQEYAQHKNNEANLLEVFSHQFTAEYESVLADLNVLSITTRADIEHASHGHESSTHTIQELQNLYSYFAESRHRYNQIRYMDNDGNEKVRVNYDKGILEVVPEDRLQKKSHRYYIQDINNLSPKETYVSPFDLNIENRKVELPYRPMIRLGKRLFDQNNQPLGSVVINYEGKYLFKAVQQNVESMDTKSTFMMLNEDGYWLTGADSQDQEWGFMFPDKQHLTFKNFHPDVWRQMQKHDVYQYRNQDGLYSFMRFNPLALAAKPEIEKTLNLKDFVTQRGRENTSWILVNFLPSQEFNRNTLETLQESWGYILLIFLIMVVLTLLTVKYRAAHKQYLDQIMLQKTQLQSITDGSQNAITMINDQDEITFWNPAAEHIFGYKAEEVIGKSLHSFLVPKRYLPAFEKGFAQFKKTGTGNAVGRQLDMQAIHKQGHELSVDLSINAVRMNNRWNAIGQLRDITEKRAAEEIIIQQKNELESIFNTSMQGIALVDLDSNFVHVNQRYPKLLGYSYEEFLTLSWYKLSAPEYREQSRKILDEVLQKGAIENFERFSCTKSGDKIRTKTSISLMPDKKHLLLTTEDVTERYELLQKIQNQSVTDELTQLKNRKAFNENLDDVIRQYQRHGVIFSLLILDVDHFKSVNDNYGHQVGDDVLVAVSKEMISGVRKTDYVYRYGGEEFVILLTGTPLDNAAIVADKLRVSVENNVSVIEGHAITVSIGVAEMTKDDSFDSLIKRADDNLYQAKASGRNKVIA